MLQFGAVEVDIANNKVYGEKRVIDGLVPQFGYNKETMAESAIALVEAVPAGVTAVSKDYDGGCYFYAPKRLAKLQIPVPETDQTVLDWHRREEHYLYLGNKFTPECYNKQFATVK